MAVSEARQYLQATDKRFDLIQLSLLDSFVSSAGDCIPPQRVIFTRPRPLKLYLRASHRFRPDRHHPLVKVAPKGFLENHCNGLKCPASSKDLKSPEEHLLFIRSWKTSTILISRSPFTAAEISRARRFCDDRSFDLAYYAGMEAKEANRYDLLVLPYYFLGAQALCSTEAESFISRYIF